MHKIKKNIILIGPMGSGKSLVGKKLSKILKYDFVDTDELIEQKTGVNITTVFEYEGEIGFRKREKNILKEISMKTNTVIATGGGIIISETNRNIIKTMGFVVYLSASIEELINRTSRDKSRPLLHNVDTKKKIKEIIKDREPHYQSCSNLKINTNNHNSLKLSKLIIKEYEKNIS